MRILYILFLFFSVDIISAQNIFDAANTRKYADHLQSVYDYKNANAEYIACLKANSSNDTLKELIAANYLRLKKYDIGLDLCKSITPHYYTKSTSLLFLNHCRCGSYYQQADSFIKTKYIKDEYLLLVWNLEYKINQMDYTHYYKWLKKNKQLYRELLATENYYTSVMQAHPKSPLKAALFSTIIPGAGKIYTGYKHDGIVSFLTIATSAFQAYRGFQKEGVKSVYGWIYGSVGVGFYLGNIYGSWKSAKKYNSEKKIYYRKKVETLSFNLL